MNKKTLLAAMMVALVTFAAAGCSSNQEIGGVSGNPRKFRHSALWNFLGGWSAA
ncbi:TPA: hypothetical protein ACTYP9_005159 [Escherichia coli]